MSPKILTGREAGRKAPCTSIEGSPSLNQAIGTRSKCSITPANCQSYHAHGRAKPHSKKKEDPDHIRGLAHIPFVFSTNASKYGCLTNVCFSSAHLPHLPPSPPSFITYLTKP